MFSIYLTDKNLKEQEDKGNKTKEPGKSDDR